MKLRTAIPLLILCAGIAAFAADFSGSYKGDFHTREGGTLPMSLTLKADGATLTGKLTQGDSAGRDIENGKVDGEQISFELTYKSPTGEARKVTYTGKLDGTQLKLTSRREGSTRPQEMTLERQ